MSYGKAVILYDTYCKLLWRLSIAKNTTYTNFYLRKIVIVIMLVIAYSPSNYFWYLTYLMPVLLNVHVKFNALIMLIDNSLLIVPEIVNNAPKFQPSHLD